MDGHWRDNRLPCGRKKCGVDGDDPAGSLYKYAMCVFYLCVDYLLFVLWCLYTGHWDHMISYTNHANVKTMCSLLKNNK